MKAILAPSGRPARVELRNYYEAAQNIPGRSNLPGTVQSANRDNTRGARLATILKSRYFYRNSGVIRGLTERVLTYAIGRGIGSIFNSRSKVYNRSINVTMSRWGRKPEVSGTLSIRRLQRVIKRAMLVDGEIFAHLERKNGKPSVHLIEAHCIGRGTSMIGIQDKTDGIITDDRGEPQFYEYYPNTYNATPILIPANEIIHFFDPVRANQGHGITIYHTAINNTHDYHDIISLEKAAVKQLSSKTEVIETLNGEIDTEDLVNGTGLPVERSVQDATLFYQKVFGPEARVLARGDKYQAPQSARPSPAWQGLMELISNTICLSINWPPSMFFHHPKMGGPDKRSDMAMADRVVEDLQLALLEPWEELLLWAAGDLIDLGYVSRKPEDWDVIKWRLPRRPTIDYGREAQNDREDVKMGMLSLEEYYSREGADWEEELRQIATEQAFIRDLAVEFELPKWDLQLKNVNQAAPAPAAKPAPPSKPAA